MTGAMKIPVFPRELPQYFSTCSGEPSCIEELIAAVESCKDIDTCRTLVGITWSCVATLIACTWVSVHPNVPNPSHGGIKLALHRLKLMLLAIIAPEIIVLWALRQRMVAQKLSKDHGLTMVQGFFVSMGGFVTEPDWRPIASHHIGTIIDSKIIRKVKSGDLEDRSKGDEVSKGLAVLQTSWFIVQCSARAHQRLPLTELEIATLAFAALNIVIRVIWWHKPLDVRFPIRIKATGDIFDPPVATEEVESTQEECEPAVEKPGPIPPEEKPEPAPPMQLLKPLWRMFDAWLDFTLAIFEGEDARTPMPKRAVRVPTLWAGRLDKFHRGVAATISVILAMGFGGIHFAAWNASFPTEPEKVLWQVAAVIMVAVPFLFFLGATMVLKKGKIGNVNHAIVFHLIIPLGVFTYIVARVMLMILPFIALRSLPPGALKDVEWIDFIPHIG